MIKYLIFDVDGTIATKFNTVHNRVIKATKKARQKGMKIAIATGRHIKSTIAIAKLIESDLYGDYIVCLNGGSLWKYENKQIMPIFQKKISVQTSKNIFAKALELDISISGYGTNDSLYANKATGIQQKFLEKRTEMPIITVDDSFEEEIFKFIAWSKNSKISNLSSFVKALGLEVYEFSYLPGTKNIEICPANVNKIAAIQKICELENIENNEIAYFGDGDNDLKALEWAGHSVAMRNGSKAAKKAASYVTKKTNKKGGVGIYIEKNLLRD